MRSIFRRMTNPHLPLRWLYLLVPLVLGACANPVIRDAGDMARAGQHEAALEQLEAASKHDASDRDLRKALLQQREATASYLVYLADAARAAGRMDELVLVLARFEQAAPKHPRLAWLKSEVARMQRHQTLLQDAQNSMDARQYEKSEAALRTVLGEDPSNGLARANLARIEEIRETQTRRQGTLQLGNALKPVTLEFREAALKTVFESLARAADVNFVFDKDVRGDAKVTLFLRNTTVEEALRVILSTQQLQSKLLNDSTVLIFPSTQQKQRDLLDTVTRTFYLVNVDPKQAQALVRTVAKTRDIFIDERLNLLVVRDTPEVVRLIERLIQNIDLPDPEVMLELEVMEVSNNELEKLGVNLPEVFTYGTAAATGAALTSATTGLRWSTTNPLASAELRASSDRTNLLANPKIRARNREKAKIVLGEKLPVFTTTSTLPGTTTGSGATVATVAINYVDVGLKLDLEPQVQLDNDVTIKVALEVSSITGKVIGPLDSFAYQVGTRQASTTLRLKDGETQILAGLINDTESRSSSGIPFLHDLPIAGRLFGKTTDERKKSEIVLLITPRIIRNLVQPSVSGTPMPSGTEAQPGAASLMLRDQASVGGISGGATVRRGAPAGARATGGERGRGAADAPQADSLLSLTGPEQVMAGAAFQVTVHNRGDEPASITLQVDPSVLDVDPASGTGGQLSLNVPARGMLAVPLKARPDVTHNETQVRIEPGSAQLTLVVRHAEAAPPPADSRPEEQ